MTAAAVASGAILVWRVASRAALRDPIAAWPWPGGDTWDFVAAGLVLRGVPLEVGVRTPLLPALIALGDWCGMLGLVPLLGLVAACAGPVLLVREVADRAGGLAATAAALALLVCQTWLRHGLEWMADVPAAVLFALAVAVLAPAGGSPQWVLSGVLGGLAALTSQIGLLLVPLAVAAIGLVLLGWHGDNLVPLLWQAVAGWGWPGSLAALAGLAVLARRSRRRPLEVVPLAAVVLVVVFWGMLYGFRAPRFVVALLPLLVLPTALGLATIPSRTFRVAAAGAIVLGAAWPLSGFVADGARLVLAPTIAIRAPIVSSADGSVGPDPSRARVEREVVALGDLAWVAARRPAPPPPTLIDGAFDGVARALVVDAAPERRHERTRHVAALVRVPTARVPRLVTEALPLAFARPLGTRGRFTFTRVSNPLDARNLILAVPAGELPPSMGTSPYDAVELARARAIAARRGDRHLIAVVEPGASWWAWLCLMVPGDWLHYAAPDDVAALDRFLNRSGPRAPVERVGGLSIEPVESLGRIGIVVRAVR